MRDRDAVEVADDYIRALRCVVSCITREPVLSATRSDSQPWTRTLWIPRGPARLQMHDARADRLGFKFLHGYDLVRRPDRHGWQAVTTAYYYTFLLDDGPELLAYHWHAEPGAHVTYPHIHLEAGCGVSFPALHRAHLPTGLVAPQQVVLLAIDGLGIRALRPDWRAILTPATMRA